MKFNVTSGAVIAAAAAAFVMNTVPTSTPASADYKIKCFGVNACKGHGSCKSTANACKGKNACKGQGFEMMGKAKCMASGGSTSHG